MRRSELLGNCSAMRCAQSFHVNSSKIGLNNRCAPLFRTILFHWYMEICYIILCSLFFSISILLFSAIIPFFLFLSCSLYLSFPCLLLIANPFTFVLYHVYLWKEEEETTMQIGISASFRFDVFLLVISLVWTCKHWIILQCNLLIIE